MAVKYDVIFKDGQRLSREAVCFGSMAGSQWSFNGNNSYELCNRDPSDQSLIQFYTAHNIHPIWEEPNFMKHRRDWTRPNSVAECKRVANRAFLNEMKILFEDLPWLDNVITIHPVTGVARAHIKDHPADKIITSLFLVRNLCNYSDTAAAYRHFRSQGLRPRLCAILAHMVSKNFGAMGRCDFNQQYLGEYNWINPQSFGKNALIQMMSATKDTEFSFIQLPWSVQRGYRRDSFYRYGYGPNGNMDQNGPIDQAEFTPENGGWLPFDTRYILANGWNFEYGRADSVREMRRTCCSHLYTRNVVDCYSIPGDTALDNAMSWNPVTGMAVFAHQPDRRTSEVVDELIAEIERVCTEAGVSIRSE